MKLCKFLLAGWVALLAAAPPVFAATDLAGNGLDNVPFTSGETYLLAHQTYDLTGNLLAALPYTAGETYILAAPNTAPVAGADGLNRPNTTKVAKVLKTALLANDTDPDVGDILSITAVGNALPSGSTVALAGNFVVYTAPAVNAGNGSFTYTLSDGEGGHSVSGTVTVTEVTPAGGSTANPNALKIVASGADFTLTFVGVPGNSYRVQYTISISPPYAWQEFSPPAVFTAPANGVFSYTDVNPGNPVRLYRTVSNP